jgi:hypothetical protein
VGKLFLKLWALLILTALASFLIQDEVYDRTMRAGNERIAQDRVRRTFVFVEEALRPYPQEEWPARLEILQQRIGATAHLQRLDSLSFGGELGSGDIEKIAHGQVHLRPLPDGAGLMMYRTLFDTDQVAVLVAPAPPPPLVFGLIRPIVFAWII